MKTVLTIILICLFNQIYSQKCECLKNSDLKNLISCKPTKFKNGAKIYWEYDCNSSWITFQNGNTKKKIFQLEKDFIEYSGRLGFRNWTEYKNSFLIENSFVSGCCQPGEYILFNKNNAEIIYKLGLIIFNLSDGKNDYVLTLKNNNKVFLTNLSNNKLYTINLTKNRIDKTLKTDVTTLYATDLFENIKLKNGILSMQLNYKETKNGKMKKEIIKFDTKKYCR